MRLPKFIPGRLILSPPQMQSYTFIKYMTHSDTFTASRCKVPTWALRGFTPAVGVAHKRGRCFLPCVLFLVPLMLICRRCQFLLSRPVPLHTQPVLFAFPVAGLQLPLFPCFLFGGQGSFHFWYSKCPDKV